MVMALGAMNQQLVVDTGTDCDDPNSEINPATSELPGNELTTIAMATLMKNKRARFWNGEQVLSISIWWIQLTMLEIIRRSYGNYGNRSCCRCL